MAIRTDFTTDWDASPRVITIAAPSVECTMQDLLDTLRWLESEPSAMDDKPLVSASGKEPLGGGTKVGLTVSLLNAQVAFEARPGPDWVLCDLGGGNLVSFEEDGVTTITPIYPTAYVSVSKTSSSSATLQEQDALQYASYGGVVSIDVTSSISGVEYPAGTMEYAVNNIQDATEIALTKGFNTLRVIGHLTLGLGDNVTELTLQGENPTRTHITVLPDAVVADCTLVEAKVQGTLDGGATLRQCLVDGLTYVNGFLIECAITETPIVLGGLAQASLIGCYSIVAGANTPTIDVGGSGQSLVIRYWSGGLKLVNKTGFDATSIDFESGHFIADATCVAGLIDVRGSYKLTDNSTLPCLLDTGGRTAMHADIPTELDIVTELLNTDVNAYTLPHTIGESFKRAEYMETKIYVDTEALVNGDGAETHPFDNINDAKDYMELTGNKIMVVAGDIIVPSNFKNITVLGIGVPRIDMNGQDFKGSKFYQCSLHGTYTEQIIAQECLLEQGLALNGFFENCSLIGDLQAEGVGTLVTNCFSGIAGTDRPSISMNSGVATNVSIRNYSGGLTITDCDHVDDVITVEMSQGSLTFDASNTLGTMVARGVTTFVDETTGAIVIDETLSPTTIWSIISSNITDFADAVWNKVIA